MAKKKKLVSKYYISLVEIITTLHGTSQFTSKKGRALWLWTALMILNVIMMISFVFVIRDRFNENKIVTQINANCKINQVPFPAVTICNFNMVSLRESQSIARVLMSRVCFYELLELVENKVQRQETIFRHTISAEERLVITLRRKNNIKESDVINFLNSLPNLSFFDQSVRQIKNFTRIMSILKHHYFTMDTIMEEVHQKCANLVLYCTFNRKRRNCDDIFFLVKTYSGFCCAFNYAALKDVSELPFVDPDPDLEYYDDKANDEDNSDGEELPPYTKIIATSESGRSSGLSVIFNVEPADYPSWSPLKFYGAKILIYDPNDYPETSVLYRYITLGQSVDIKVEPMVFQSQSDLRRVDPSKRACWFHDEVYLGHTDRYSYETCITECKMNTYLQSCGCVPYKYPRDPKIRTCEFEDLRCLNNVTAYKSVKDMRCTPICYVECRDKKYQMTSDVTPFLHELYPGDAIKGVNVTGLAAVQVYFSKSNCNCYKLSLVIDLSYFIATYGGIFSLSFGGSIITFLELAYLLLSFVITWTSRTMQKCSKQ